jgi:hypothetical protein
LGFKAMVGHYGTESASAFRARKQNLAVKGASSSIWPFACTDDLRCWRRAW